MADETTEQMPGGTPAHETGPSDSRSAGPPAGDSVLSAPPADQTVHEAGPVEPARVERGRGGRGRGDRGGSDRRGGGRRGPRHVEAPADGIQESVVKVYRCAKVVKGGRRFSFAAMVVVGNRDGQVGIGYGKANEVPSAVEKGNKAARRNMTRIKLAGTTIPHRVMGRFGASKVLLLPAGAGTGVIAGGSVRAVMELAGVKDVLTKSYGSNSPKNLVKAAFMALQSLRSPEDVARLREVSIS